MIEGMIEPEKKREHAKHNAEIEKRRKQSEGKIVGWWILLFMGLFFLSTVISGVSVIVVNIEFLPLIFTVIFLLISGLTLPATYKPVPEKEEWIIEFMGRWLTTWEADPHFLFPFFMKVRAEVYMGVQMTTLYMDGQDREGETNAMVDFTNTSAPVVIRLYFRIFSSHRAVYEVENVIKSIKEKMDAGIRAYYGGKDIDTAIRTRAEMNLDDIISQANTEAGVFKAWGVEIIGIAVVDIQLPDEVLKQRAKILEAEKDKEASLIAIKTAENKAEAKRIEAETEGKAIGQEIKKIAEVSGLSEKQAAEYLLNRRYFESIKDNKGVIIAGRGTNAPLMGTELGAGLSLTQDISK